jgi:hypothetical protein
MNKYGDELSKLLESLQVGEPVTVGPMTVFPLTVEPNGSTPDYLTADEALSKQLLVVTEEGEGTVPEILVANNADVPVLVVEGEELVGAKQNRVLNITVLIPAHTKQRVPVSCVERGRWHYAREGRQFGRSEYHLFHDARREKVRSVMANLRHFQQARSDQSAVWRMIGEKSARMAAPSPTDAMDAIYERYDSSIGSIVEQLRPVRGQVGALTAIGGRMVVDCFGQPATWERLWRKILAGCAIDALDPAVSSSKPIQPEQAQNFIRQLTSTPVERTTSVVGLGEHLLFQSEAIEGFALCHEGRLLHLFAYAS